MLIDSAAPICLSNINRLSITAECVYGANAQRPMRIHVRASSDGIHYDTTDLYALDVPCQPGQTGRKTFRLDQDYRFIKVMAENLNDAGSISDVKVIANMGS